MNSIIRKEYNRLYHAAHREERNEYNRRYNTTHRDAINERNRQYRENHREERKESARQYSYAHGTQSMSENKGCSLFLGVHVAERMLSHLFKGVARMPHGNPGYDFICGKGQKIDVKSSCEQISSSGTKQWRFSIKHNTTADYFLCIAFDNRNELNPQHIWLIPGDIVSHLTSAAISETTIDRWTEYEKPVGDAIVCCNVMKTVVI